MLDFYIISGDIFSTNVTASGGISGSIVKGQQIQAQEGDSLGFRFNLNEGNQVNALRYKTISTVGHAEINALPLHVTKDISGSAKLIITGEATLGGATTIAGTTTTNGILNAAGTFQIGGVAVTSTAAELNILDGFTGTVDDLNSIVKVGEDSDLEESKIVRYSEIGTVVSKQEIRSSTATLTTGESNALLIPSGADAQTYTLPAVAESKGVSFRFIPASAERHILTSAASNIYGYIMDNANDDTDSTMARTELEGIRTITLLNPKIGDCLNIVSDGVKFIVEGHTNDTPTLA
jgi:hypothetical protein